MLVLLGLSVSLDELAIGFTLGLLRVPVLPVVILVGVQAIVVSQIGLTIGFLLPERLRRGAGRLAGAVLAGLGFGLIVGTAVSWP